ncbi:MAG: hypothetical protein KIT33_09090 [Candidatus Kapabacteria bacterium]|nr:hypothetical protein [Candidatus Kapabacteria bacterium]
METKKKMILMGKYHKIYSNIALSLGAKIYLFAILLSAYFKRLISPLLLQQKKFFCLINFVSTNSQRKVFHKIKIFILFEELKIPGITIWLQIRFTKYKSFLSQKRATAATSL